MQIVTSSKLRLQLCRQCVHNLIAILSPLLLENVPANAGADLPVKQRQTCVDGAGNGFAGRENEFADVRQQRLGERGGLGGELAGLRLGGHGEGRVDRSGDFGKGELCTQCGDNSRAS